MNARSSLDLDEIDRGERAERHGRQGAADIELAQIHGEHAELLDQLSHLGLGGFVVARIEENALAAGHFWLRQELDLEMVEKP